MDNCFEINDLVFKNGDFILKINKLAIEKGDKIAILGKNGSGKTTLLNVLSNYYNNYDGDIIFFNKNIKKYSTSEKSKKLSYLPQFSEVSFGYTVFEIVLFGRFPYLQGDSFQKEDFEETEKLLEKFDLIRYKDIQYSKLSGGEKRRVMIAKILNQNSDVVLLDEPTSMIDINFSINILETFKLLASTIVASIHDINLSLMFFNRFFFIKNGNILYNLRKEEVTEEVLDEIFEVKFSRIDNFFIIKH